MLESSELKHFLYDIITTSEKYCLRERVSLETTLSINHCH